MSFGLGTTSIFGTGCRYQVPTRTREDANEAAQDMCVMVRMGDRELAGQLESSPQSTREHNDKPGSIILHHSHFVTLRVTKM
jgi:hypothetical protein